MTSQTPLTVFLIDDSAEDRALYRYFLSRDGAIVCVEATTGAEGLRRCKTDKPDCLVLDFHLPDMDGFELLDTLHAQPRLLSYPVVRRTGQGGERVAVHAMHLGVQDYLVKDNLPADTLCDAIRNAIDKFRLRQLLDEHQRLLRQQNLDLHRREQTLEALNAAL